MILGIVKGEAVVKAVNLETLKSIVPELLSLGPTVWSDYDREADVLYICFQRPMVTDDSEMVEDDVIVHYGSGGGIIGVTLLNASQYPRL